MRIATIRFDKMAAEVKLEDGTTKLIKINRKKTNKRMRPNPEERFRELGNEVANLDVLNLINSKDLEWMAWNWRTMNFQLNFFSRKNMVYELFHRYWAMLPSPE